MAEENRPPEDETPETPARGRPVEETPTAEETPEEPAAAAEAEEAAEEQAAEEQPAAEETRRGAGDPPRPTRPTTDEGEEEPTPREKPLIPGADLEVDIVREGEAALRGESEYDEDYEDGEGGDSGDDVETVQPIAVEIDLASGARYRATGKRKTSSRA